MRISRVSHETRSTLLRAVAASASGFLLALAYEPFGTMEIAWVAFVPLLLVVRFSAPFSAFRWAMFSGLVFWLTSLVWLLALGRTGGPLPLVVSGWLLLASYCALYTGAFGLTMAWLWRAVREWNPHVRGLVMVLLAPLAWAGFEYLRSTLFTGFAWNQLGVSQYRNTAVIQIADVGGVYLVSALLMAVNMAVTFLVLRFVHLHARRRTRLSIELMIALLLWGFCIRYGIRAVQRMDRATESSVPIVIAAIQPNIPQLKKWPEDFAAMICSRLEQQTRLAATQGPDLIVWPETAVPGSIGRDRRTYDFISDLARLGTPLLAGVMEERTVDGEKVLWNSSFLFGSDGQIVDRYRKVHLVPFGEYLPLENVIPAIKQLAPLGFSCRPGRTVTVFRVPTGPDEARTGMVPFASLICFEDTVAALARRAVQRGARLLVNQTNDAWFDGTAAARQHMSHCVFRCVENRVPAVRSTNTGVTAFIDRAGRISVLENEPGVAYAHKIDRLLTPPAGMPLSVYTRGGDRVFGLPCGVAALGLFVLVVWKEKRESLLGKSNPQ